MKKYVSIMTIVLSMMAITLNASGAGKRIASKPTTEFECCKNCKDDKCKELCKKWSNMTTDQQKSDEGKKVKEECLKICKEKKCCSTFGKCEGMEGKGCCKKEKKK